MSLQQSVRLGLQLFILGAVDIRPEKRARRELGAYCGQLYRGSAHSHYLHACKAAKKAKDKEQAARMESKELRKAWNSERVRKGEVVEVEGDYERCHFDTLDSSCVMREGWKLNYCSFPHPHPTVYSFTETMGAGLNY